MSNSIKIKDANSGHRQYVRTGLSINQTPSLSMICRVDIDYTPSKSLRCIATSSFHWNNMVVMDDNTTPIVP